MRVLIGYTNHIPQLVAHRPLPGREAAGDDILAFGAGYTHLRVAPDTDWKDILAQCPPGWRPDVYIHWSPEYNPVPRGMEQADCLTVGVWGDWNLGGQAMRALRGVFDVEVADALGCERLRGMGARQVVHAHLWAQDPAKHRRLDGPDTPARDIDILMIGNFNHAIQWERAPWLARVARLSRQYKVVLTSGLYDAEYVRAMNRAKIVFNRSIRGEANMRAYEAPACGALLFYETENREIRDIYTDREHCVLYDDDNLETLLAHYLDPQNAEERERIAHNGWQRVQSHDYAHHLATMLDRIQDSGFRIQRQGEGTARQGEDSQNGALPLNSQLSTLNLPMHWLLTCNVGVYEKAERVTREAGSEGAAQWHGLRALMRGEMACCATSPAFARQCANGALNDARRAVQLAPDWLPARCNLAALLMATGDTEAGEREWRAVARYLDAPDFSPAALVLPDMSEAQNDDHALPRAKDMLEAQTACGCAGEILEDEALPLNSQLSTGRPLADINLPLFPRRFDWFDVAAEWLCGEHAPGSPNWTAQMRALLTCRIHVLLADLAFGRGQFADSAAHAGRALQACARPAEAHYARARACRALGQIETALEDYAQTLERAPFHLAAREENIRLLMDAERFGDALRGIDEWLAVLNGCPVYAELRPGVERMRRETLALTGAQAAQGRAPAIRRLLALPDWNDANDWQSVVRAFADSISPAAPTLLMLRADPAAHPDANSLLRRLERFLTHDLGLNPRALPDITLLHQPLAPADCWKLARVADAFVADRLPAFWNDLAHAACKPVLSCSQLAPHEEPLLRSA